MTRVLRTTVSAVAVVVILLSTIESVQTTEVLLGASQSPVPPDDLSSALAVIMNKESTSLQKRALVGKRYSGVVTVADVNDQSSDGKPAVEIVVDLLGSNYSYVGKMSVNTSNVETAAKLRKGAKIRITGQMSNVYVRSSGYSNVSGTEWTFLVDATIDEVFQK